MQNNSWDFKKDENIPFNEESYFMDHKSRFLAFREIIRSLGTFELVCDIGIGIGSFYKVFENNEIQKIYGVDIVPEFIEISKQRGLHVSLCDINSEPVPFDSDMFDLVVCDSMLEHTFKPNFLISECLRILKPGGYLLLSTPNALSFAMRWNYLRGRNQFWPLIHNLISEIGYLKRCSIFYGLKEIKILFPDKQVKPFFIHEDFWRNRKSSIIGKIINLLAIFFPSGRNMIAVVVKK
ncbi:hypothetical protein BH11PAT1_BH11PAT1_1530 [soil metagenome]